MPIQNFFHSHARYRRRKSFISKLVVDGCTLTSHDQMEDAVWEYYSSLLGSAQHRTETLNLSAFHHTSHDLQDLEAPISEHEVWDIIKTFRRTRHPGRTASPGGSINRAGQS